MLFALCVGDNLHTYDHYSFHGDCILRTHHVLVCHEKHNSMHVHVSEQKCMLCTKAICELLHKFNWKKCGCQ